MENNSDDTVEPAPVRATGLLASLQRLLGSFSEILHTRLEILSTEAEETGLIVGQLIAYTLVSVLFLALGLLLVTAFIIIASPESYQLYVLAGFGVFYLLVAVVFTKLLLRKLRTRPKLFAATLAELDKDLKRLGTRS